MYSVIEYLEDSVRKHAKKIAVIEEDKKITYSDLNKYSKRIGSFIAKNKIFNEPIIIFMDKGIDTLISFLGTIYSGCFYSLINPEFPESRIVQIRDVIKSKLVITDENHLDIAKKYFNNMIVKSISELKEHEIDEGLLDEV